jgi:hypothetical protein
VNCSVVLEELLSRINVVFITPCHSVLSPLAPILLTVDTPPRVVTLLSPLSLSIGRFVGGLNLTAGCRLLTGLLSLKRRVCQGPCTLCVCVKGSTLRARALGSGSTLVGQGFLLNPLLSRGCKSVSRRLAVIE